MYNDYYLIHHGIKGQRWGVRRFQNEDGSLTSAGKKRSNKEEARNKIRQAKADAKAEAIKKKALAKEEKTRKKEEQRRLNREIEAETDRRFEDMSRKAFLYTGREIDYWSPKGQALYEQIRHDVENEKINGIKRSNDKVASGILAVQAVVASLDDRHTLFDD